MKEVKTKIERPLPEKAKPYTGKTLGYEIVSRVIVVVVKSDPSKEEWNRYCDFVRFHAVVQIAIAVYEMGGGPSPLQRKQVLGTTADTPRLAMFTNSELKRCMLKAMAIMVENGERLAAFPPDNEHFALEKHLGLTIVDRMAVVGARKAIESKVG